MTADVKDDVPIPGEPFSFGVPALAQGLGDLASLDATERRALHVHLPASDAATLDRAASLLEAAATNK